jgi:hypothetical protein
LLLLVLPVFLVTTAVLKANADTLGLPITYWERSEEPHGQVRAAIQHWLTARPRNQLVFVRYESGHNPSQEWVYNGADIDHSKVVWAREMDPAENERLMNYFHDREVWLLRADDLAPHVVHYSGAAPLECDSGSVTSCSCDNSGSGGSEKGEAPAR